MLRSLLALVAILLLLGFAGAGGVVYLFYTYGSDLPDYKQLADYEPPVMTRVHAGDGRLLAEYATERRVFVPVEAIPRRVIHAFLSAEDKNFYEHPGVDFPSVMRAVLINVRNMGSGRRPVGASTITQQVAKNFLLTNEVSFERKIKEAILSFRIERAITKNRILELYLNEIYLGYGSYGVAAAALNYFDKSLGDLTLAETAFLAALPKAPNNYNPQRFPDAAKARRDWVIGRMFEDGAISLEEAEAARAEPLTTISKKETEFVTADFFAEEVRREILSRYGESDLYKGGLLVRTTLDPKLQEIAKKSLRKGLHEYDRRHGWRGPIDHIEGDHDLPGRLAALNVPSGPDNLRPAVVTAVSGDRADIAFADGTSGHIPFAQMRWARPWLKGQKVGARPSAPSDVLKAGDVVYVEPALAGEDEEPYPDGAYALQQIPAANGGLIALDPHTGRVLAMLGGYDFSRSQFNRVTQAYRQPGSAFKPFVYLTALDSGYTPSTLILDAPFVIDQGPGLPKWKPANYTRQFYGPSTMRLGIEKSRNLMTVRLAQTVGMNKIATYAERFGIVDDLPESLSMSLGAGETSLIRMTAAYAMLVNGGKRITPTLIDRVQDRHGRTVFRHDTRDCPDCLAVQWNGQAVPNIPDIRESVTDPGSAYQVVSMLQGVVERGTGRRISEIGKPLAGKTGTTNDSFDTWFVGFTPDLAVGVYVGFDTPSSLGKGETGSNVAAPIFKYFMEEALRDRPAIPFRIPPEIRLVRVDSRTGLLARPGDKSVILEAFKAGTVPSGKAAVIEGQSAEGGEDAPESATGTGGLY
ncbi:MAG: penicillin-binding protein 1A [Rhodospirillales bacterium]|nr:penicillin-binding protein 1A [Rhodospirillales bacterium]MCW8863188.1 penicillin-binding protein 1A [Rhodospirillales bacterium]MCW8952197.1 penicillin-binding protein 1A [Rhodospirillales bacterium]